jgi:single-strand DNA-binding protein
MASLNRVILCGNLTDDPELSYLPSGLAVCRLKLAVNERVKNPAGEWVDRPCYIDVSAFERTAENANQYLKKGSPLLLEGRLRYETWDAKDGTKRSKHSVVADRIQFIGSRPATDTAPAAPPPTRGSAPPPAPLPPRGDMDDDLPPF